MDTSGNEDDPSSNTIDKILEENKQLRETIQELVPKVGNQNNINFNITMIENTDENTDENINENIIDISNDIPILSMNIPISDTATNSIFNLLDLEAWGGCNSKSHHPLPCPTLCL